MELFSKSEKFKEEYSCRVCKIGQVSPIPNSDFLGFVIIGGETIVVRKDQVKEDDVFFYVTKENVLRHEFLSNNNLYMFEKYHLNSNREIVQELLDNAKLTDDEKEKEKFSEQAKRKCGFFNETRRVRVKKIREVLSAGYIFGKEEMIAWQPKLKKEIEAFDMEANVGLFFDTVGNEEFCHVYIPKKNVQQQSRGKNNKHTKKSTKRLERFDHIIQSEFAFHYDTGKFGDYIYLFKPDTRITASVKRHGTSAIFCNILCNFPLKLPKYKVFYNKIVDKIPFLKKYRVKDSYRAYDVVYASRRVIKNQYINEKAADGGFYKTDVWEEYYNLLKDYIPKDITIYGEICGYISGTQEMIQKNYDYGCEPGTNTMMIYRITTNMLDGTKFEWEVPEVKEWTEKLVADHPDLQGKIVPIDVLYDGTLGNLYKDIPVDKHWHENVLIAMKNDKEHFGMELDEPLCNIKVPREGIVIRIYQDVWKAAFKLKTDAFALLERKQMDSGVVDVEMANTDYGENDDNDGESET